MKLVILDRDGVINEDSAEFIKSPEEWVPIPGSLDAIARLNRAGWRVVVATNQSGLRRRLFDIEALNRIHNTLHRQLAEIGGYIEAIFFCPCLPRDDCECYKPNPGMIAGIGERLRVDLATVPFIGDGLRDLEAARRAGARPWLVRTGKGMQAVEEAEDLSDVTVVDDLASAADRLIRGVD
jgi:D-glycero-D-manno-heptose 1,7-bisphosphate phosphatase